MARGHDQAAFVAMLRMTVIETAKLNGLEACIAWADPNHPDIDYSIAPFELAHREGHEISGWWVIQREGNLPLFDGVHL
jgi:hypothetical protein